MLPGVLCGPMGSCPLGRGLGKKDQPNPSPANYVSVPRGQGASSASLVVLETDFQALKPAWAKGPPF